MNNKQPVEVSVLGSGAEFNQVLIQCVRHSVHAILD